MTRKERFKTLVSPNTSKSLERSLNRINKRAMLRESRKIAFRILERLEELGWSQKKLAQEMCVSPQQVNKLVKGKENLTLETQVKLQSILDIPILASYYEEEKFDTVNSKTLNLIKSIKYEFFEYSFEQKRFESSENQVGLKFVMHKAIDEEAYLGETNNSLLPTG
ncbi:helix-turn-helix transcriptional regulator [Flagellimonas marinaquae]